MFRTYLLIICFILPPALAMPRDINLIKHFTCSGNAEVFIEGRDYDEGMLTFNTDSLTSRNMGNVSIDDDVINISGGIWKFSAPDYALNSFAVLGNCQVTAKHWNGTIRNMNIESTADTFLEGFYTIHNISHNGDGRLMVYWIDNPGKLFVDGKAGKMFLAGDIRQLVLSLSGNSELNGSQLRAHRVLARTSQMSKAAVHPIINLSVFAQGQSQVSYTAPIRNPNLNSFDRASIFFEPMVQNNE